MASQPDWRLNTGGSHDTAKFIVIVLKTMPQLNGGANEAERTDAEANAIRVRTCYVTFS